MTKAARIQVIRAELERIRNAERPACQPCAQVRDALNARLEALAADFRAHEGRECKACAETEGALDARRWALTCERLDLLAGW
jgi:hypothetical protein